MDRAENVEIKEIMEEKAEEKGEISEVKENLDDK